MNALLRVAVDTVSDVLSLAIDSYELEATSGDRKLNKRHIIVALLVIVLSDDSAAAEYFLLTRKRKWHLADTPIGYIPVFSADTVLQFLADKYIRRGVHAALMDMNNAYRRSADEFVVEKKLALFVSKQSWKGVIVSTQLAIDTYLKLWSLRPRSADTEKQLLRLMWHRKTRMKFSKRFRDTWRLSYGKFEKAGRPREVEVFRKVEALASPSSARFLDRCHMQNVRGHLSVILFVLCSSSPR